MARRIRGFPLFAADPSALLQAVVGWESSLAVSWYGRRFLDKATTRLPCSSAHHWHDLLPYLLNHAAWHSRINADDVFAVIVLYDEDSMPAFQAAGMSTLTAELSFSSLRPGSSTVMTSRERGSTGLE